MGSYSQKFNQGSLKMKVKAMPIFTNGSFTDSDEEICKAKRRISFDENVHVFDMSKPAPKSPKRSKMITPILKQSPNVSSDEETEYLIPKRTPIPKSPKSSRNTGTIQSQAFLDEVINELKNHQQKVNNDLVTIPLSPKNENENKSYGHRRSPSSHDFFKSHSTVEDQIINSHEKYQVIIDITNCKKDDLQIKAKENLLEIDGKILEAKKDGTNVTINFSKKFNLPNVCQTKEITSIISENQLIITAPKMPEIKTGFRSVPIVFSQKNSEDGKKKSVNEKEQNVRLGRKLSQLGQKYNEIDQSIEQDEKPTTFRGNRSDRIFGIRHGINMKPIEMPGFDFNSFKNYFDNDDLSMEFENDMKNNFPSEFDPTKWASFHDELLKTVEPNARVTNIPIAVEEKSAKPKFGSCHSQDADLKEFLESQNGRFHVDPSQKSDKLRHVQRVPVQNRATFKNSDLDQDIIKASKMASASHPWFQTDLGQDGDSKTVKISCL